MGLPQTRHETLHIQSQLTSGLLNLLQDMIVDLYGTGWSDQRRLTIPPHWSAQAEAGNWALAAGSHVLESVGTNRRLRIPVRLRPGTRIDEVLAHLRPSSASPMTIRLVELALLASGGGTPTRTVLGTQETTTAATWQALSLKPLKAGSSDPYEVIADRALVLELDSNVTQDRIAGAEVLYQKSRLT